MKKVFSLLIMIVLSVFMLSFGYCEEGKLVDFDKLDLLTDEELLVYDSLIEIEKANRNLSTLLPDGTYLVGRDIPSGYYRVKYFTHNPESAYSFDLHMRIYISEEKRMEYEKSNGKLKSNDCTTLWNSWHGTGELQLFLENGNVLYVTGAQSKGTTIIEKASALFSD